MIRWKKTGVVCAFLIVMSGCLDPYSPSDIEDSSDILVVDGFINTTDSVATVRLSHTLPMDTLSKARPEENAVVTIESDNQSVFTLQAEGNGVYALRQTLFDNSSMYRVHVRTQSGKEYQSDYTALTTSPPIDSVTWAPQPAGIDILVNTHDPTSKSRYYYWTYEETWEYVASFYSTYKLIDGEYFPRGIEEQIYTCWSSFTSNSIYIGTSSSLAEDVIRNFPVAYVPMRSTRLKLRYSILVKQRTLTEEAYEFWQQLEKTTETLGGLFDPQPYQLLGNIHSVNDSEPVLGYFSGGSVAEKRIFVDFTELPTHLLVQRTPAPCGEERQVFIKIEDIPTTPNSVLLIDPVSQPGFGITGFLSADAVCIDCRLFGGTTQRPDFWR